MLFSLSIAVAPALPESACASLKICVGPMTHIGPVQNKKSYPAPRSDRAVEDTSLRRSEPVLGRVWPLDGVIWKTLHALFSKGVGVIMFELRSGKLCSIFS